MSTHAYVIAALYKFRPLPDFAERRDALFARMEQAGLCGTILLAAEGINGTIAGSREGIDELLAHLRSWPGFGDLRHKESYADEAPFKRLKVKRKKEIVTMGIPDIDPTDVVGTYVPPHEWNELIASPDVVLIDTRNDYEVEFGTFHNAINPEIESFRDFPQWLHDNLPKDPGTTRAAMFCTGGIRCEKATSYLRQQGYTEVYHLQGGILDYLAQIPEEESLWEGSCFVFDERISVGHGLQVTGDLDSTTPDESPAAEQEPM